MSATLNRALAAGSLKVRNQASGEAIVVFRNPVLKTDDDGVKFSVNVKPVRISNGKTIDMFGRKDVDRAAVKQSNIEKLVKAGVLEVL
ncbi:hypothetical protein LCGC14_0487520 [marine sediment metagenome]|jgi:hypothetical protein|uniref:Uncharacterized protein n=1 Tax=marine sediment metagenome TaxID=412755 RepID=A0A0F9SQR0_9ZZZZ